MSFTDEYYKALEKEKKKIKETVSSGGSYSSPSRITLDAPVRPWRNNGAIDRIGQDLQTMQRSIASHRQAYNEIPEALKLRTQYANVYDAIHGISAEEEEELLKGMTPTQRAHHQRVGGAVNSNISWADKTEAVTKLILAGGDTNFELTDKLLKQLKAQQDSHKNNDLTWEGESAELQGYYNSVLLAKQANILSNTQMDGKPHSVLKEMEIIAKLDGDDKKKRKEAVLKKMEELGIDTANYAMFSDDSNFTWDSFGGILGESAKLGLNSTWHALASTADLILGNPLKALGWENNPFSSAKEYYEGLVKANAHDANLYKERLGGGSGWQLLSDATSVTAGAVPQALMALASGFASAGATATTTSLTNNAAYLSGDILTKAGIKASTMAQNPQFWMSFASTLGNDYEEAKQNGASDTVAAFGATFTSLLNAGIEMGFDGGSGIQGLADDLAKGNKKKVWAWVESTFEEGGEEGLQKFVNETVTKVAYNHEADVYNPLEYAREMGLGTIAGATLGGGQTAIQSGVNAYSEYQANKLTGDEQAVVDKVTEMLIAQEQEKSKNELSNSEKKKIAKTARMLVEKGYVKADTIESVLGGESYEAFKGELQSFIDSDLYKQWKSAEKGEKDLPKLEEQLAELGKLPSTVENTKKYDALQSQIEAIKNAPKSADLKAQLDIEAVRVQDALSKVRNEVYKRVKGSRLAESYRELIRSKEKFTADPAKYDNEYSRQTVQNILNSGLGDGSNQFRDTVEFLARISADQESVVFDLTDTDGIKKAGHYKEGYVTNGYVTDDGKITLNYDSPNMLESIVGHEITHVLEKAGNYKALRQSIFDYAISKEGLERFNARIKAAEEAYKGKTNTSPEGEVAADLIGEYLFTDYNFISNLAKTDMNGFQRFWDGVKHLYKMAVAGSKEARQLEKVKHMFEKAYNENLKGKVKPKAETEVGTEESKLSMSEELTPSQAQMMNIFVSNITNVASRNGISLRDFYIATSDINAFGMTKADAKMTADLLQPIVDQLGIENYQGYLDKMRSFAEEDAPGNVQGQKNTTNNGGVKHSISKNIVDVNGKEYDSVVVLDKQVSSRVFSDIRRFKSYILNSLVGLEIPVLDENGNTEIIEFAKKGETTAKNGKSHAVLDELVSTKGDTRKQVIVNAEEVINESVYDPEYSSDDNEHGWLDENGWEARKTYVLAKDGKIYEAYLKIAKARDGRNILYAVNLDIKKGIAVDQGATQKRAAVLAAMPSSGTVAQKKPTVNTQHSYSSIANSFFNDETMATEEFLNRDYHETEFYKQYTDQCIDNMRQTMEGFDESKVDEYRESIRKQLDGIVEVAVAMKQAGYDIRDTMTVDENGEQKVVPLDGIQDSKKRSLFTSLEPNSDYITSHDISTICDKRKNFAEIYDEIVRIEEAKGVPKGKRFFDNVNNYFAIHKIMADKGLTTPCRQCYVESMRKNLAPMATAFLELVQETNPNNTANAQLYHQKGKDKGKVKESNEATREFVLSAMAEHPEYNLSAEDLTIEMLTTEDGLAQLRIQAPLIYEAFNSFYGQAKPKMPKSATPFRFGELTAMLTDSRGKVKKGLIEKINSTGGFRLQSYSDFQIQNYADVLQVLFEAGTLGLNGHAYTKVPAFLDATEGTNLKRNISIFMYKDGDEWKLDRNDSFPYSLEEIYELVKNDKTGNTSIIAVSQNREMSAWIMANDLVGYGIPFHKSGLKMATVRDTIVRTEDGREVKGYTGTIDHTKQQTEVYKSNVYDEEGKLVSKANTKVKKGIDIYNDLWDFENKEGLSRNELIKKNLMAYIDKCEELGYRPKFREYVMNNGGVLNDVLRFAKELGFADENATIDDISFEYKGYRIPYGYYKFLGDFGMFTPDGKAAPQKPLSLENYDFGKAQEFFADAEALRRTEILQQFANGKVRDEYRESDMTTEDLENLAAQKRTEVAHEALGIEEDIAPVAEDIAPVGNGAKLSMSKAEDVGYHAGDLGKAESFAEQGYGRATGHFGTGTYFVGNEDAINIVGFRERPHHKVDFGKYNLYMIRDTEDGYKLHRDLNFIDGGFSKDFLDAAIADKFRLSDLRGEANNLAESYSRKVWDDEVGGEIEPDFFKAHIRAFSEVAKANDIDILDYDAYLAEQSPDDVPKPGDADYETYEYEYYDYLLDALKDGDSKRNEGYEEFRKTYFNLWLRFGMKKTNDALQKVLEHDAVMEQSDYDTQLVSDSRATVFMKALGYEGIDVRETGLDNTSYGSVIYDLKGEDLARKQEIGTAKFSMSKADTDYMNAINSDDLEAVELMVEEFAKSAGYDTRMFHETDAENIHIFDISRGTHGGTDYQTPYGIFTKTSPKNIGLGSKQMSLFVKAHNTLRVENRDDVVNKIPGFAAYYDQITEIDKKYDALANELEDEEFDALMEWMEEHPDADMDVVFPNSYIIEGKPADIDSAKYLEAHKKRTDVMAEWSAKYDAVAVKAKAFITDYLRSNGYDSMYFAIDGGSRGRQTDSLIVLDENQVKSAAPVTYDDNGNIIPLSQRFNAENNDTRYSMSPETENQHPYGYYPANDNRVYDPLADFAPVREDVAPAPAKQQTAPEDVAPMADDWRESFESLTDEDAPPVVDNSPVEETDTVIDRLQKKIDNTQAELDKNRQLRAQSSLYYDEEIARLEAKYESKKNKESRVAQGILRSIERLNRLKGNIDADYAKRISDLEARIEKMSSPEYRTAEQRRAKMQEHTDSWESLIGDTSTWKDFALGLSYKTKTLRRILRKVVRGADGKPDIELADRIYDELETKYDHNEALLKRESARVKEVFEKLKLNHHEDTYAHMLGELRHNPQTELTKDVVDEYYNKHKKHIDTKKVDTAISEARKTFDDLIVRVNEVLREQGFKEIPYRKGYFPHFTNPKQTWLHKLFNWKPVDNEIPTSIAGLTEQFKPQRSWQTFNKQRKGDTTDYSLYQGLDTYIHGALDWIYHIDDLQSRRALENHIRYIHSEEGVKARIDEIKANEYLDADEAQKQIEAVLAEASNPLNGFVTELMRRTNTLANKKASGDRKMEDDTNRKIYSTMTNLNNRINANMVVGSLSSALTNFIPMVQSWHQVSPVFTVRGLGDYIRSVVHDDGMVERSDFLTNRLMDEKKLYQTGWDKVSDKAAWFMNIVDGITSNTVWRSKYLQNIKEGMSEAEAIKDADQFAKNVMAGRSRGNAPTIFDEKNPVSKLFTAFQLEVANQYGYMFEDVPQDSKNMARLVKGYATAFVGAYLYNALYSSLVGRDAAFDPISIFEELFKDLGWGGDDDEEEEPEDIALNLIDNILEEVPFVGGLVGGGRIPISSALPYEGDYKSFVSDAFNGEIKAKELLKPLYYLAMPVGGGQIKKTVEGLSMFDDDLPISGSYTDSGALRFPVEKTFGNVTQAALFGQYANKNAREYFDNGYAPLGEKQIQEYQDVDIPISDYWKYRKGLSGLETAQEKADYINDLDLPISKKNILINNQLGRKEPVDMTDYDDFGSLEEFDFANDNPEKYDFFTENGITYQDYKNADDKGKDAYNWAYKNPAKYKMSKVVTDDLFEYRKYTSELDDIRADQDANGKAISGSAKAKKKAYIESLNISAGAKMILFKSEYPNDDSYNKRIVEYLIGRDDIPYADRVTIMEELGFTVKNGMVYYD